MIVCIFGRMFPNKTLRATLAAWIAVTGLILFSLADRDKSFREKQIDHVSILKSTVYFKPGRNISLTVNIRF